MNTIGILGGGLAGLTVAAHLREQSEVLEADSRPGGHCQSAVEQGFTYDVGGPHIMFSRNQKTLDYMMSLLEGNLYQGRRNNKIFYRGRYVKYPFENGLNDLEPQDRFECLYHYLKNDHPAPTNFKEWMYHTFGTGLTDKYLLPYNEKIWKIDAAEMSMDWVEGRVPKPPIEDVIKSAVGVETEGYTHQLYFYYPERGGIEALPAAMAKRAPHVVTDFPIRHVRKERSGWVVSDGSRERRYESIICTIPLHIMVKVLEGVPEEIQHAVRRLRFNSLITVTLGLNVNELPPYTAIYVPDREYIFHRLSFPGLFSPHNTPEGQGLVQAEITVNPGDPVWSQSDEQLTKRVSADLETMGLVKPGQVVYQNIVRTPYGYVVRDFNYRADLDAAKQYFASIGIPLCGRGAEFEYINMDQCIERAVSLAEKLNQEAHAVASVG